MKVSDFRKAIRLLQIFSIVISLLFLFVYSLCLIGYDISLYLCPFCGVSLLPIIFITIISKRLHVSSWSMFFYYLLIVVIAIDIVGMVIPISKTVFDVTSINFMLLSSGSISSFITYLYDRFKNIFT